MKSLSRMMFGGVALAGLFVAGWFLLLLIFRIRSTELACAAGGSLAVALLAAVGIVAVALVRIMKGDFSILFGGG